MISKKRVFFTKCINTVADHIHTCCEMIHLGKSPYEVTLYIEHVISKKRVFFTKCINTMADHIHTCCEMNHLGKTPYEVITD